MFPKPDPARLVNGLLALGILILLSGVAGLAAWKKRVSGMMNTVRFVPWLLTVNARLERSMETTWLLGSAIAGSAAWASIKPARPASRVVQSLRGDILTVMVYPGGDKINPILARRRSKFRAG